MQYDNKEAAFEAVFVTCSQHLSVVICLHWIVTWFFSSDYTTIVITSLWVDWVLQSTGLSFQVQKSKVHVDRDDWHETEASRLPLLLLWAWIYKCARWLIKWHLSKYHVLFFLREALVHGMLALQKLIPRLICDVFSTLSLESAELNW